MTSFPNASTRFICDFFTKYYTNQYECCIWLYVFTVNITGYGLGPMVVAFLLIKFSKMIIDLSIASMFLICGPISFLIFYFGREPFARALVGKINIR